MKQDIFQTIGSDKGYYNNMSDNSVPRYHWLLTNEEIKMQEEDLALQTNDNKIYGKAFVTNYRLRFEGTDGTTVDVTLGSISKVEKKGYSNVNKEHYGIEVHCKDTRNIIFLHKPENHSRRPLYDHLQRYAFPNTNKMPFFATLYNQTFAFDGWSLYKPKQEYQRMKVRSDLWDVTKINFNYEFASTYPAYLMVPVGALKLGDTFLFSVGDFRSKRRIPVLSWYDTSSTVSISRCSQPMVGMTSKKSPSDEKMLQLIIDTNRQNSRLKILDARPIVNAKVNRAKGGGYEDNYRNCDLVFLNIDNIHVVRESLKKIKDACFPKIDHKHFYKLIDESRWLHHLQTILQGSRMCVQEVLIHKKSVLVHCSDGWDRTAQVTALSMLLLDPYYRTIEGFAVLIEKEWCSFGHKFAHRVGHGEDKHSDDERSPIFLQFIDCVWQLFNLFTSAFEFNVKLLKTVLDELYACRFGTFLYNSEKERRDLDVKSTTVSLWSYVMERRSDFENPGYDPTYTIDIHFFASTSPIITKLWTEYYCRYNPQVVIQNDEDFTNLPSSGILEVTSV
ncbi:unnamed protein product [Bursaphelenchus okinawaensis]|uniref:phosphatidylinositol-3,5-bisphosphate 3-phosphatase n=1 Tax=Bursaphelenchus okinawaensis TaxID=465554 RepID=A0A811JSJ1_9BILA|nr:unnamed protein product [Bursaphelenchus okinawaensis]CAG9081678.1 unnamed protein product [Bursaphelenchus okinawaensis]